MKPWMPFVASYFGNCFKAVTAVALFILVTGCAVSGPKYITLEYQGHPGISSSATLGISRFEDKREDRTRGVIGHRTLNNNAKEVYLVQGLDVAGTITDVTQTYLERKGLKVVQAGAWDPSLEGLAVAPTKADYLLTGRINKLNCHARKKGALTEMTLEIDFTLFLGMPGEKRLTTIPVALTLTRTDINFTRDKLEDFFNQTLADVLVKALPFDQQL